MRLCGAVKLQVRRYRVVDRLHLHGDCRLLCVCYVCLLDCSHDRVLGDAVGESELIEICLVLSDTKLQSLVDLCILCIQVGEVDLLTLQLGVLTHMESELCKLLC